MDANKSAEMATAEYGSLHGPEWLRRKPFAPGWGASHFTKWATVAQALSALGVGEGAEVLDVGCGGGWTTLFLAETGYRATGMDLAEAHVRMGRERAARWGVDAQFVAADMDEFELGTTFDAVLFYDALHHSRRQPAVIANVVRHLKPGGWVLFGEPSLLHAVSPGARRQARETGWIERGIGVRQLKRDCRRAGLGDFRRFAEPSLPFERSVSRLVYEASKLVLGTYAMAPRTSVWLAARAPTA